MARAVLIPERPGPSRGMNTQTETLRPVLPSGIQGFTPQGRVYGHEVYKQAGRIDTHVWHFEVDPKTGQRTDFVVKTGPRSVDDIHAEVRKLVGKKAEWTEQSRDLATCPDYDRVVVHVATGTSEGYAVVVDLYVRNVATGQTEVRPLVRLKILSKKVAWSVAAKLSDAFGA